jgi:hypothetical protein
VATTKPEEAMRPVPGSQLFLTSIVNKHSGPPSQCIVESFVLPLMVPRKLLTFYYLPKTDKLLIERTPKTKRQPQKKPLNSNNQERKKAKSRNVS